MCDWYEYALCHSKTYHPSPSTLAKLENDLSSCRVHQRERLEAMQRKAEEQAKADAEEAAAAVKEHEQAAAREKRIETLKHDAAAYRFAWSANLCQAQKAKAEAKAEIEQEKKYAREGGGIVDKDKLYELQGVMRSSDERIAASRTNLKTNKLAPLLCSDKELVAVFNCFDDDGNFDAGCSDERLVAQFKTE